MTVNTYIAIVLGCRDLAGVDDGLCVIKIENFSTRVQIFDLLASRLFYGTWRSKSAKTMIIVNWNHKLI